MFIGFAGAAILNRLFSHDRNSSSREIVRTWTPTLHAASAARRHFLKDEA
jgi:hypothetical protein